jgi:thioredoxin reductase
VSSMPTYGGAEKTTTVIIGAGLSGLAVASELRRHGVDSIIVNGLDALGGTPPTLTAALPRCDAGDAASRQERNEILRHLRNYAASHHLDIRNDTRAVQLDRLPPGRSDSELHQWAVHTATGVLFADHIVLTRCGHSQLRRMLSELGMAVGENVAAAMRAVGIYLVGVGELVSPTPKEVLRQAKVVGQAIAGKVHPDRVPSILTGSFAALPSLA